MMHIRKNIVSVAIIGIIVSCAFVVGTNGAYAQVTNNLWKLLSGTLQPVVDSYKLKMPYLSGSGTVCLQTDNSGNIGTSTLGACGSGGSGTNYFTNSGADTYLNTGSNLSAPYFTATSTTASTFPYASSTALTVSGNLYTNLISSAIGLTPSIRINSTEGNVLVAPTEAGSYTASANFHVKGYNSGGEFPDDIFLLTDTSNTQKLRTEADGDTTVYANLTSRRLAIGQFGTDPINTADFGAYGLDNGSVAVGTDFGGIYLLDSDGLSVENFISVGVPQLAGCSTCNSLDIGRFDFGGGTYFRNGSAAIGKDYAAQVLAPDDSLIVQEKVGVGTTTPGTILSLGNTGNNTINISTTATSTFGSGIDIRTGCFAVNGTCVGGGSGSGTVNSGTTGQIPYYAANGTTLTATSSLTFSTAGNIIVASAGGGLPKNIDFGATFGAPALYLYNNGVSNRWGWGLNSSEMQFFSTNGVGNRYTWNVGGDQQTSGTNELMRLRQGTSGGTPQLGIGETNPEGTLHVKNGSAGSVTASTNSNTIVMEASGNSGFSLLTPDANYGTIYFGSPTDNFGAQLAWSHNDQNLYISTQNASDDILFRTGDGSGMAKFHDNGSLSLGTTYHTTAGTSNGAIIEGNLGIGTTTPFTTLSVVGNAYIDGTLSTDDAISVYSSGNVTGSIAANGMGSFLHGSAAGAIRLGANVNASGVLSNSTRKVARIVVPSYSTPSNNISIFAADFTSGTQNNVFFGTVPGGTSYGAQNMFFATTPSDSVTAASASTSIAIIHNVGVGIGNGYVSSFSGAAVNPSAALSVLDFPGSIKNMFQVSSSTGSLSAPTAVPVLTIPSSGNIGIGTTSPSSNLEVWGSQGCKTVATTTTTTLTSTDCVVYVPSWVTSSFTINLPTVSNLVRKYTVKNRGTGVITLDGASSEPIDGTTTFELFENESVEIISTASTTEGWIIN